MECKLLFLILLYILLLSLSRFLCRFFFLFLSSSFSFSLSLIDSPKRKQIKLSRLAKSYFSSLPLSLSSCKINYRVFVLSLTRPRHAYRWTGWREGIPGYYGGRRTMPTQCYYKYDRDNEIMVIRGDPGSGD